MKEKEKKIMEGKEKNRKELIKGSLVSQGSWICHKGTERNKDKVWQLTKWLSYVFLIFRKPFTKI